MPPTPEETLDFERDIAPATTRFIRTIQDDPFLDPEVKRRLGTSFYTDVSEVRQARVRNLANQQASIARGLNIKATRFDMERARRRAEAEDREFEAAAGTEAEIGAIIDDELSTPEEKSAALGRLFIEKTARAPRATYLTRMFRGAQDAVSGRPTGPTLTGSQALDAFEAGVPREVIESGDIVRVGTELARIKNQERRSALEKEEAELRKKEQEAADRRRRAAIGRVTNLDFAENEMNPDVPDTSRFRDSTTAIRIKQALAEAADPELRRIGREETDPAKLRKAFEKFATAPDEAPAPRPSGASLIPPRPR